MGLLDDALSALVRSSAEKDSEDALRGMEERWVGRGIVSVILAIVVVVVLELSLVVGAVVEKAADLSGVVWLSFVDAVVHVGDRSVD